MTLLKIVAYLTVHSNFELIQCYIYKCFEKIVVLLEEKELDYTVKVEICKFLAVIGQRILDYKKTFIGLSTEFVIKRIVALTTDRIGKVQMSAREALRIWKKLEKQYDDIEKMKTRVKFDVKDPEKLIEMNLHDSLTQEDQPYPGQGEQFNSSPQNGFQRSYPAAAARSQNMPPGYNTTGQIEGNQRGNNQGNHQRKEQSEDSLERRTLSSKENSIQRGAYAYKSNNIVEKTYLKQKAHNFQKKRTGTGGGFIVQYDKKEMNRKKASFNEMREKFKTQIMSDKMNFTRQNARNKYQNHFDEKEHEGNEYMEEIQEDPNDLKPSRMVGNSQTDSRVQFQTEVPVGAQNASPSRPSQPSVQAQGPPTRNARGVPEVNNELVNNPTELTFKAANQGQDPRGVANQEQEEEYANTLGYQGEDGEYEGEEPQEQVHYEDHTGGADEEDMGRTVVVDGERAGSIASTVYYGNAPPQRNMEQSLASTKYYPEYSQNHEDKTTQYYDDRTVLCESVDSYEDRKSVDSMDREVAFSILTHRTT